MRKQTIKIGGGGIASLPTAINLRLAGFDVIIFERGKDIGLHRHNDWEGLENWTSDEDILEFLKKINIKINFTNYACSEMFGVDSELNKYQIKSKTPLFYLIKRGPARDSLDQCLKKQAQEIGVRFEFNKTVGSNDVDIVSNGHTKKSFGAAAGITFKTDLKDTVICILNNALAPQAYAYLLVVDHLATLATCFIALNKSLKIENFYLEKTIEEFQKIKKFSIKEKRYFGGLVNVGFLKNKTKIYVGEAAGFQDAFLGFGMKYAFLSGFFAAESLIKSENYKEANKIYWGKVKKEIYPLIRTSIVNRFIYQFFTNKTYKWFMKKIVATPNVRKLFQKQYQPSFLKNFLFPIAKLRTGKYLIQ